MWILSPGQVSVILDYDECPWRTKTCTKRLARLHETHAYRPHASAYSRITLILHCERLFQRDYDALPVHPPHVHSTSHTTFSLRMYTHTRSHSSHSARLTQLHKLCMCQAHQDLQQSLGEGSLHGFCVHSRSHSSHSARLTQLHRHCSNLLSTSTFTRDGCEGEGGGCGRERVCAESVQLC